MPEDDLGEGVSKLTVTVTEDDGKALATNERQDVFATLPKSRNTHHDRGKDITATFSRASNALNQGQLVKDDFFTLFESIMDPKMDSGFILPAEDAVLEDFDPMEHTLPEEVIWIMDQMLSFEMMWHEGAPLSQTLFTSLHLFNLLSTDYVPLERMIFRSSRQTTGECPLVDKVLRAYCLSLAKCLDNVIMEITSEHFYEEEDFISATFSRLFVNRIDDDDFIELLDEALEDLHRLDIPDAMSNAISIRLRTRKFLLEAMRPEALDLRSTKPEAFLATKQLLGGLNQSHDLGQEPRSPVFSERVQRYLASNTPPRPIKHTSWPDTVARLEQMSDDALAAFEIGKLHPDFDPATLMRFVWSFASRLPKPHTYTRALAQGLLFKSASILSSLPHLDLLLTDIRMLVLPASPLVSPSNWTTELPSSPRYQIARNIDEFLRRSLEEYLNLYRMPLQNRCRIRRTLVQSIPILDSLQALAEESDASLLSLCALSHTTRDPILLSPTSTPSDPFYPLASWVYHHKLSVIVSVLLLGFELEIYLPPEYASMYALLSFFATSQVEHYTHLISVLSRQLSPGNHAPPNPSDRAAIQSAVSYLSSLASKARLLAALASATADLYSLLAPLGLITVPEYPFSTRQLRYEVRMRPFLGIGTPTLPSCEELEAATTTTTTMTEGKALEAMLGQVCDRADEKIRLVKAEVARLRSVAPREGRFVGLEMSWEREWRGALRSAVGIGIGVAAVRSVVGDVDGKMSTLTGIEETKARVRGLARVEIPGVKERGERAWVIPRVVVEKKGKR
ncbi:Long chain acyl-CoA synthetase 6, peroxisomal [Sphaceloma murrayae]|uniref:Long chain acyl-CoA synthetase 6, peroxisomal n=1 Tax=Sphaceloma murrayae TaxID=2082308 RepID=A0A2K1QH57_9PEZI|nr:Long chain acyl-CoA synthetase 6, peroxisomal [Sphaceloma murrayae]